ncbi:TetR/AcrR family transcriptional regulator [Granulicoccus phenolivorans]|uniref:TetR/AcrR family transcriptional regulator n=1 Tax=Granulicoccus phenolivorans TaxID=266854 RepID=UPI0004275A7A|nr:TetR/AcrR family transcriptional regulator [Granulicoccus phenolivorans]
MSEPDGPDRATNARYQEYVRAAIRIFSVKGYTGTTLADIGAEAHVSQPRISQVFGTKENAFLEAHRAALHNLAPCLATLAQPSFDAGRIGQAYPDLMTTHRAELMIVLQAFAAADCPAIGTEARAGMHEIIALLQSTGAGYPEIRDFLARTFLVKIALAADIGDHLEESAHFAPLLDSLHLPIPPSVDPGAAAIRPTHPDTRP